VSQSGVICKVVDTYDIDIWVSQCRTKEVATNTSKTINSNINHEKTSSKIVKRPAIKVAFAYATTLGA
jgi:hypothetical protein